MNMIKKSFSCLLKISLAMGADDYKKVNLILQITDGIDPIRLTLPACLFHWP